MKENKTKTYKRRNHLPNFAYLLTVVGRQGLGKTVKHL
jgi:hypothetical protein